MHQQQFQNYNSQQLGHQSQVQIDYNSERLNGLQNLPLLNPGNAAFHGLTTQSTIDSQTQPIQSDTASLIEQLKSGALSTEELLQKLQCNKNGSNVNNLTTQISNNFGFAGNNETMQHNQQLSSLLGSMENPKSQSVVGALPPLQMQNGSSVGSIGQPIPISSLLEQINGGKAGLNLNQFSNSSITQSNTQSISTANFTQNNMAPEYHQQQQNKNPYQALQTARLSSIQPSISIDQQCYELGDNNCNLNNITNFNGCDDDVSQDVIQMKKCSISGRCSSDMQGSLIGTQDQNVLKEIQNNNSRKDSLFGATLPGLNLQDLQLNAKDQKLYQMPLQFSDKFFDEDPGLIKIIDTDRQLQQQQNYQLNTDMNYQVTQATAGFEDEGLVEFYDKSNISRQSIEYLKSNLNLFERKNSRHDIPNLNSIASADSSQMPMVNAQHAAYKLRFDDDEQSNEFDKAKLLRKANELTRAIDNQFSYLLSQRDDYPDTASLIEPQATINLRDQEIDERTQRFASIFNSPVPNNNHNSHLRHYLMSSQCEPVVNANNPLINEQLLFSNYTSNTNSKPNLLLGNHQEEYQMILQHNQTQPLYTQRLPLRNEMLSNDLTQTNFNDTQTNYYDAQSYDGGAANVGISTIMNYKSNQQQQQNAQTFIHHQQNQYSQLGSQIPSQFGNNIQMNTPSHTQRQKNYNQDQNFADQNYYIKGGNQPQQQQQQHFYDGQSQYSAMNQFDRSQMYNQGIMGSTSYEIFNDTKNFSDRNSKWINQQQYKKNQIKDQMEEQQLKECTFKPQTNNKSSKMLNNRRNGSASTRNEKLYEQKGKKLEQTQQRCIKEQEDKLQQNCTFKPSLNEKERYGVGSRYMQITEDLVQNRIHVNDFYNAGLQQYKQEETQMRECTFAPQINQLKKSMQTAQLYTSINAFERLSKPLSQLMPQIAEGSVQQNEQIITETQNQSNDLMNPYLNNTIPEEESEIDKIQNQLNSFGQQLQNFQTFNNNSLSPTQQQQMLAQAHQQFQSQNSNNVQPNQLRFSNISSNQQNLPPLAMTQNLENISQIMSQSQLMQSTGKYISRDGQENQRSNSKMDRSNLPVGVQNLLERQSKYLERKEENIKKIKNDITYTHKPVINDLACSLYLEHSQGISFNDRQNILLEKKQNMQLLQPQYDLQNCTFQPQITKLAQNLPSKTIEEQSYGDLLRKQQKIDKIAAQMDAEIYHQATFRPELISNRNSEFDQVQSKLSITRGGLDEFIQQVNAQQQQRAHDAELLRKMKEDQELQECTYRPQTINLPEYIRKIAEESKKIKAERAILESQLPPQKPEFRI
eukprot:403365500